MANGVGTIARSFKYHRPRGVYGAGAEEPNAFVRLVSDSGSEPNVRATDCELVDGLVAVSQNNWPSLHWDFGRLTDFLHRLTPAGFYYKTFMWPTFAWPFYEKLIRGAAGVGIAPEIGDSEKHPHRFAHCDVLIVGGGPTGLSAARAAQGRGKRVVLVDEQTELGGSLIASIDVIEGLAVSDWIASRASELDANPDVLALRRASAIGLYDDNMVCVLERGAPGASVGSRFWWIRAKRIVLACGALERPMIFGDNDLPGIMLASAARTYALRYGVAVGRRIAIYANNDSAYETARDLSAAGLEIAALIDTRPEPGDAARQAVDGLDIPLFCAHAVTRALGRSALRAVETRDLREGRSAQTIACDALAVSGGWSPTVHLHAHGGGRVSYDAALAAFVPENPRRGIVCAGAMNGNFARGQCLAEGRAAAGGEPASSLSSEPQTVRQTVFAPDKAWRARARHFVDLQNDVTLGDLELAALEGYQSVEHVKRYTTLGMGMDQGRTSNVNGIAILSEILARPLGAVGTTTFRPPYTPVRFAALAGERRDTHYAPVRRTPLHDWHLAAGAPLVPADLWQRPLCYPRAGENTVEAAEREARQVRQSVGIMDVSTLGKIELCGRDVLEFLSRVYANGWRTLDVGRCRYGIMLREDGIVFDDGTVTRLAQDRFLITTTTTKAAAVFAHIEKYLQLVWPDLDVHAVPVTDQWMAIAVAGPQSRALLESVAEDIDLDNGRMPFMTFREGRAAGAPARFFRISFSGELAWEVAVPADYGPHVWEALLEAGRAKGVTPYGMDAMITLRIEKGHIAGNEINGRTTPDDLGLQRLVGRAEDFVGRRSLSLPGLVDGSRRQLVGLRPEDRRTPLPAGAQIIAEPLRDEPASILGETTSRCVSPHCGMPIALALVAAGRSRIGATLHAVSPLMKSSVPVVVERPVFFDPEGARLRA
jgi:sarcosine oxidase subunit alpha